MTRYTHPDVADARDSPENGATMEVVVVVEEGFTTGVANVVSRSVPSAQIEREFDTDMILVDLLESDLNELHELEHVESISPNEGATSLA